MLLLALVWSADGRGEGVDWSDYFPGDPLARPEGRQANPARVTRENAPRAGEAGSAERDSVRESVASGEESGSRRARAARAEAGSGSERSGTRNPKRKGEESPRGGRSRR